MLTIVGLGPSDSSRISVGAVGAIRSAPTVFVRTARHPAVDDLAAEGISFRSFDHLYETSDTFEEVYARISECLLAEADRRDVVYAVPGHPLVGESAVGILIGEARRRGLDFRIIGSESFIEASLEALGIGFDSGLKIIDALSMDEVSPAPDTGNLIYQVYGRDIAADVKLRLMDFYPDDFEVVVVSGAATSGQRVDAVPLYRLDRCDCDHLTTVYVPPLPRQAQGARAGRDHE